MIDERRYTVEDCTEEDTIYLNVHISQQYVDGYCRVGNRMLQGRLEVNPAWASSTNLQKAIDSQTRSGQLSLNDMHGFDWEADYALDDLKLDYPVVITEMD